MNMPYNLSAEIWSKMTPSQQSDYYEHYIEGDTFEQRALTQGTTVNSYLQAMIAANSWTLSGPITIPTEPIDNFRLPETPDSPDTLGSQKWYDQQYRDYAYSSDAASRKPADDRAFTAGNVGKEIGDFFGNLFKSAGGGLMSGFAGPALLVLAGLYLVKSK